VNIYLCNDAQAEYVAEYIDAHLEAQTHRGVNAASYKVGAAVFGPELTNLAEYAVCVGYENHEAGIGYLVNGILSKVGGDQLEVSKHLNEILD